jgi:hypothetical protein
MREERELQSKGWDRSIMGTTVTYIVPGVWVSTMASGSTPAAERAVSHFPGIQ